VRETDSAEVRGVLEALADGGRELGALADSVALAPGELSSVLGELEIAGRIVRDAGGYALAR
jgi:predicted Rossmann fold nucleotide-binding protein DprA/Smf involved in DNA uptake